MGVDLRHVALKWDVYAVRAVTFWFLCCLGYTVFVYAARFLLTLVVDLAGPVQLQCHPSLQDC